jgi:hypothetical protein
MFGPKRITTVLLAAAIAVAGVAGIATHSHEADAADAYVPVFAQAVHTPGTVTSAVLYPPPGAKGFRFTLDATARSAPATLTATLYTLDPQTGHTVAFPTSPTTATLSSATTTDVLLYPGITGVTNRRFNDLLISSPAPVPIKIIATVGGTAGSVTFSGSGNWISMTTFPRPATITLGEPYRAEIRYGGYTQSTATA